MTIVNLEVNEKEIPLNDFMQKMLKNIILGYLESAKDVPDEKTAIKIIIEI